MNQILTIILILIFSTNLFSQQIENNKISSTHEKGNWAIRAELGVHVQSLLNQDMLSSKVSATPSFSLYYKNFFFNYSFSEMNNEHEDYLIDLSNVDLSFGYNYDFLKMWSSDLKLGVNLLTMFSSIRDPETNGFGELEYDKLQGLAMGIGLNRYIKLRRFNYIVTRFGIDYYSTNYNSVYSKLGRGAMNYNLTIGYKGWFKRKIAKN